MFVTDTGVEVPAITTDQMREVDRIAIEETGPNLYQMMENAGRNLATLALDLLGDRWRTASIVVLAGTGGNGGGGICAARHLANRGARVMLCISDRERLGDVPRHQLHVFESTAGQQLERAQLADVRPDLILDALVGYTLQGAPRGTVQQLIGWANASGAPIAALDVPSGIDSTTAASPGDHIAARWTMTLALPKTGLVPERTGGLYLADIGIPAAVYRKLGVTYASPFDHRYVVPLRHSTATPR